ncbi:hypothetical protein [Mycobacterium servetii]|uniref:Integral membrane protein n=1 Tax=Mycobacterium servetii TaxID=3237418 RepID=A0ABV4C6F4_9MYCO
MASAVAALTAPCVAVLIGHGLIGQGMMFANQTAISAILVLALYRSGTGFERIFDALIGGAVALVFAIVLCPADRLAVPRTARRRAGQPADGARPAGVTAVRTNRPGTPGPACGAPASARPR